MNDVRFVKDGVAHALRTLRRATTPEPGDRVVPLSAQMVGPVQVQPFLDDLTVAGPTPEPRTSVALPPRRVARRAPLDATAAMSPSSTTPATPPLVDTLRGFSRWVRAESGSTIKVVMQKGTGVHPIISGC